MLIHTYAQSILNDVHAVIVWYDYDALLTQCEGEQSAITKQMLVALFYHSN